MTPFLAFIDHFCTSYDGIRANIFKILTCETTKNQDFDYNTITNDQIFDQEYLQSLDTHQLYGKPRKTMPNQFNMDIQVYEEEQKEQKNVAIFGNQETNDQKITKILDKLIVQPFIELLQYLLLKKADPYAQVQKLKRFREIDEKRRLQLIEVSSNGQNIEKISQLHKNEERARRREEVLKERKERKHSQLNKRTMKSRTSPMRHASNAAQQQKGKQVQKKEEEYDHIKGLQNAFHLVVKCPHPKLIQFFEKHKINADAEDHLKTTPLNLLSSSSSNIYVDEGFQNLIQKLVNLKVRVDYPDNKGRTPFLNFYGSQNMQQAEFILQLGANVNQMDHYGLSALKYAMIRRNAEEIQKLAITYKANINQADGKGRNLLHHAINMSSSTADATFDIEQVLIDLGININLKDNRRRTPLHYAFVKMKKWNDNTQIDPIETVSSLCGCKGLEIDVQDVWMKTPLHYASQRGASICAMYLQKRGADLESIDIYGNTPLGVGILSKHFNYGIILIQKNADVLKLVHHIDTKKADLIIKQQETKKDHVMGENGENTVTDSEADKDSDFEDKKGRKHRRIFDKDPNKNQFYGSEEDSEDQSDDPIDSESNYEQNVFNQQNAFGFNVFNNQKRQLRPAKKAAYAAFGAFGGFPIPQQEEIKQEQEDQTFKDPQSMFRLSIKFGQLGLAYLMLDQGYNLMKAMQDALDEKKFLLVLTFLGKNPDDQIIRQKNDKNQNLFHILSQNASSCRLEHLKKIYNALRMRGVNCLEQDGFGRTALHYAVESRNKDLVLMLLEEGADPSLLDIHGFSPLILYLKGKAIKQIYIYNQKNGDFDIILKALLERGANINQLYTESSLQSIYYKDAQYENTPIINFVRQYLEVEESNHLASQENLISGFQGLLLCGARFDLVDSDGCDVLIHAIRNNHNELFSQIIQKSKKAYLRINNQDVQGKTAIHHIVKPRNFGSFENVYMIDELFKLNFQLQIQDAKGFEPIQYSLDQKSGKLRQKLAILTKRNQFLNNFQRKQSGIPLDDWQVSKVEAEQDSDLFLKEAQQKEDSDLKDLEKGQKKLKELVPVDVTGRFEKSYRVFSEQGKPWDAYLTKVDLKNGIYGDYVFYKIQLLHDSVRDLYVVFTRYGRIGEDGMNQRSPFNKAEDAKKEFCSIFKSKTANEFNIEDNSSFQRQNKKYNLAKVNYSLVQHKDYLAPFDFDKCAKSQLDKQTRQLLEEIANITMYQRAMAQIGIDTSILPLSNISKQTVHNAMEVLKQLSVVIDEDQALQRKGVKDIDYELLARGKDKIVELSSKYYELIPLSRYKDKSAPPISQPHQIQQLFSELETLVNIEHASKVLLGALYRQKEMHPIDYVYQALNVDIKYVDPQSEEHQTIELYVKNTNEQSIDFLTHKLRVFRIQRKGESEQIQQFDDVPNHRLLFHGSQLYNFLGILSQGLRIAPPEAPATGYMFGKGIYFADALCKSFNYAYKSYGNQQDSNLLLLCQVVIGNSKKLWKPEYVEHLQSTFQSVHGVGRMGPDYKRTLTLDNGVQIPFGKMIEYKDYDPNEENQVPQQNNIGFRGGMMATAPLLQHNEFIVYDQSQVKMRYLLQIIPKSKEELMNQK